MRDAEKTTGGCVDINVDVDANNVEWSGKEDRGRGGNGEKGGVIFRLQIQ